MSKNTVNSENYLSLVPKRSEHIVWTTDEQGMVTLQIENTGAMNTIAQKLFKKPRISYVHLDENGSFVWPLIDGEKDIIALGELVKEKFGEKAEPLYPRLAQYFRILDSYGFVEWE